MQMRAVKYGSFKIHRSKNGLFPNSDSKSSRWGDSVTIVANLWAFSSSLVWSATDSSSIPRRDRSRSKGRGRTLSVLQIENRDIP